MKTEVKVLTYLRSQNQTNNFLAFTKLYYKNAEVEHLQEKFFNKSKIHKTFYFIKSLISCLLTRKIIIIGDFRLIPFYVYFLFYLVKKIVLVDDGLSSIWFLETHQKNKFKHKTIYFTKYLDLIKNKNPKAKIIKQDIKKPILRKGKKNIVFIGGPYIDFGYIEKTSLIDKITYLKSIYASCELIYFSHPREKIKLKDKRIKLITGYQDLFLELEKYINLNTIFIGCFSSGLIDAKLAYPNNKFVFFRLPNYLKRDNEHLFGFNVEKKIYMLFEELGFEECDP
jgi:hypothetical protein